MSGLANYYRWQIFNGTGGTVTVTMDDRKWKFDSSGALSWASETTPFNAVAVTTGTYSNSSGIDNSSDKYLGTDITLLMDVAASLTGAVTLFLQTSTDGGTTWPSDGQGLVVGSHFYNASSTDVTRNYKV